MSVFTELVITHIVDVNHSR